MSCVGDGKCMKLCKDINVCLINYDHEISSNYASNYKIENIIIYFKQTK